MRCPSCHFDYQEGAKFCIECGNNLTATSKATHQVLSINAKLENIQRYFPKGLAEKILSQKDKIEGERRNVTVMFCDMKGFTPLVERLGSEEAYSIMDQVYEILIHKVYDFEGIVNEMTGDGIMALFGAPIALEDAPQRALWSSLSIHQEISKFNDRRKTMMPVKMRIGIHTGPVVVGTLGNDMRVEFKAVGDTVNLASRMEGLAEAGTTYVTEETFRQTEGLFQFESIGKKEIKGKDEAISVYQVISGKEDLYRPRLGSERMIYSEMVGRERELNRLELQVMKAINGEGSVVNIIGEAGIGKSRLVAELRQREVMKRATILEGRSIAIGRNLSFHPITNLLRHWARISREVSDNTAFDKLETAMGRVFQEETRDALPFIATLMGIRLPREYADKIKGIEGEDLERLILKTVRDFLIKATTLTPLVIVMEDMHWADASSIELIESLLSLAEKQRILLINVFRPGHAETSERIIRACQEKQSVYHIEIFVEPLDEHMTEELIRNMLHMRNLPYTIRDQIVERTGGNPFFIEEVVRSFIDEGTVVLKNGVFEVTEKKDTVEIPQTVNDVLMARIDRLDADTRNLIKVASVMGRNFFYEILSVVAGPMEDIDGKIARLMEGQFIKERRIRGGLEYFFIHALAQEAVYESILQQKRKELHLKVADAIESVFADRLRTFYGILVYHYSKGGNLDKAEDYLLKAGEEALRSSASTEALNYYQEALRIYLDVRRQEVAPDSEKVSMLEKNIALALFNKGRYPDALKYFDSVLERWGIRSLKNRWTTTFGLVLNLLHLIINLYLPSKKPKKIPNKREHEIITLWEKRLIALAFLQPSRGFVEFLRALRWSSKLDITKVQNGVSRYSGASALFSWTGFSFRLSKKILDHVKGLINEEDREEVLNYRLYQLYHDFFTGDWSRYKEIDESLLNHNLRIGQTWQVSTYIFFRCSIKIEQGYFRAAEELISKMSEIWEAYQNENTRSYIQFLKIRLLTKSRKLYDAQVEVDEDLSLQSQTGRELAIFSYTGFKAITQILSKDIGGARESLAQAKSLLSQESHRIPFYIASYLLGQFLIDLCLLEEAILSDDSSKTSEYGKKAFKNGKLALKNSRKIACDRIEVLRLMGLYYWLMNSQNKAIEWWRRSMAEGERLGDRVELSRTHMEIGKRLQEKKSRFRELDRVESDAYLEKARISFEQMGLDWDLDELEKIKAYR